MAKQTLHATQIEFSVKELLIEINSKIDRLAVSISSKAEKAHVDDLLTRVGVLEIAARDVAAVRDTVLKLKEAALTDDAVKANQKDIASQNRQTKYQWISIVAMFLLWVLKELVQHWKIF